MVKILLLSGMLALTSYCPGYAQNYIIKSNKNINMEQRQFTFNLNENVELQQVSFTNRFGITLRGDLYTPKGLDKTVKHQAIAVAGPFGACKEQAAGFYANEMASRGFVVMAFDPSFTGESGGEPRYVASPDINTDDFSAAVDFLSTQDYVNPEGVGIIGICGWGGMALNAAAIDTRIKATVASTMYDMTRVTANGYFDAENTKEQRMAKRKALNAQRTADYKAGAPKLGGGLPDILPADAPEFFKDYHAYYKTPRGYHKNSLNSNGGWNITSSLSLLNSKLLAYADEIETPVMVIHGEKAHSRYFGEDAFKKLQGDNKQLLIIPGASHVDLYDNKEKIPFEKMETFFKTNLK